MKSEKISFLKRAWLAITDFRMYPYMLKEKFGTAFGYFIKFLIVISVIIAAFTTSVLFKKMPVIQNALENKLPEFSLSNGILSSNENMQYKLDDNVFLVFEPNSNYAQSSELKLNDSNVYDFYIMAFSDTFVLGVGTDGGIVEISKKTYDPLVTMNKVDLIGMFNDFTQSSVIRATILISITLSTFIVMLIRRLTNVITFIISTYLINFLFKVKLKAVDYFKIFIYASTLPIILSVVALLAVGRI